MRCPVTCRGCLVNLSECQEDVDRPDEFCSYDCEEDFFIILKDGVIERHEKTIKWQEGEIRRLKDLMSKALVVDLRSLKIMDKDAYAVSIQIPEIKYCRVTDPRFRNSYIDVCKVQVCKMLDREKV